MKKFADFIFRQFPYHVRPGTPMPVLIAGLIEADGIDGTLVVLIDPEIPRGPENLIFKAHSDENGFVRGQIPRFYEGRALTLRIAEVGWLGEEGNRLTPEPYGIFFPAKLQKDTIYPMGGGTSHLDHNGSS